MESLAELRELKEEVKDQQADGDKPEIIIGMGTCGIAAGARKVLKEILNEIDKRELDVTVNQTGCIAMCEKEPLVDVRLPGKSRITYGNVGIDNISKIIVGHVVNGNIVNELAIAKLND
ncbi:(2Fe-2S) ferredoxin domain-containing protein [Natroniella acetigena]|uniref:(2Fe-2S) ferredoxin domain-containing protein n=1 Tax=Natroniella acetigena TaxID=52004 RepID=UPI002009E102|nr:(2Fe-2S) ferredoxin domain-containing protein [Natroniella acetigena]